MQLGKLTEVCQGKQWTDRLSGLTRHDLQTFQVGQLDDAHQAELGWTSDQLQVLQLLRLARVLRNTAFSSSRSSSPS